MAKQKNQNTFIKVIVFEGKKLKLSKVSDAGMNTVLYLDTMRGEPYIDINKILPDNYLLDAIWVQVGGKEEKIADTLDILKKTNAKTKSGFNQYVMYDILK
jgi:hypothetical protein